MFLIELAVVTLACVACYLLATRLIHVVPGLRSRDPQPIIRRVRGRVLALWAALALLALAGNGWLLWRGIAPREYTLQMLRSLGPSSPGALIGALA